MTCRNIGIRVVAGLHLELCGVLGGLAGVVLAQAVPQVAADVDEAHLVAVAGSFRAALYEAREKRRAAN